MISKKNFSHLWEKDISCIRNNISMVQRDNWLRKAGELFPATKRFPSWPRLRESTNADLWNRAPCPKTNRCRKHLERTRDEGEVRREGEIWSSLNLKWLRCLRRCFRPKGVKWRLPIPREEDPRRLVERLRLPWNWNGILRTPASSSRSKNRWCSMARTRGARSTRTDSLPDSKIRFRRLKRIPL